tara:strand:+ start:38054 stop:39757 length:1704 start_codon:yes stop_codon:yes gene_type:complete
MPLFQDMGGQLSNRGLQWSRFQEGSFANNKLPEEMVSQITAMRSMFMESFSQFAINDKTGRAFDAFKGMIFTVFAPNFIGDDLPPEAKLSPEQQATLDFARNNNIVLPSQDENPAKQIGTDWWFSHYAYAWKDQFEQGIEDVGASQSNKVVTVNNPELARSKGIDYGPVQIAPTSGGGYGVFINTDAGGSEGGLVPMLGIQAPQNMDKFFMSPGGSFKGLRPNQSNIILPEGPQGNRVEYARQARPRNRSGLSSEQLAQIEQVNQSINDARQDGTLWQLRLAEDGTLFAKSVSTGDEAPLSKAIVQQLIKPEYFEGMQGVVPAKTRSDQTNEAGVGNMGRWKVDDEVKAQIMGDPSNPYSNPRSVSALRQLRIDINEMRGGNRVELNGYHIITIGPKFSNPENLGEGQTTSAPGFVTPQTMVNPADQSVIPVVERGTKWVVLVDEFQGEKLKSQGRRSNPKKKSAEFDDLHKAFEWAKGQYGGDTSAFDVGERTIRKAMDALQASSQAGFDANNQQMPAPQPAVDQMPTQQVGVNPAQPPMNSGQDMQADNRIASANIRRMMKRMSL